MENKPYPRIKNAILLCLLLLVIQIVLGLALGLSGASEESLVYGAGIILINVLSFGIVILIGFKKTRKGFNEVFKFNNVSSNVWISVVVFMFGFVILSSEIDNLLNYILPMPDFLHDIFISMLVNEYLIVSIILVGISPAFLEEMLFRGVILYGFKENYTNRKAILMSAFLFGFIHLNPYQFVTAFIIGIVTAWIYIKTDSILPCIYIHLFNNMLAVLVLKYSDVFTIRGFNTVYLEHSFQPLWFNAIGIVLTAVGAYLLINSINNKEPANPES